MSTSGEFRQRVDNMRILFSRISLPSDQIMGFEAGQFCEPRVQLPNLLMIASKEFQEASLSSSCAFDATETERVTDTF